MPLPGQITRGAFVARLRERLVSAINAELADVGRTAADCPYMETWITRYEREPADRIERVAARYAGGPAPDAAALFIAIEERARRTARTWKTTGQIGNQSLPSAADEPVPPAEANEGGVVRAKSEADRPSTLTAPSTSVLDRAGPGTSLAGTNRGRMETALGASLADIMIHTGPEAALTARAYSAHALTIGRDVIFGADEYRPGTLYGDLLLAHELAHVLQQDAVAASAAAPLGSDLDPTERIADSAAVQAATTLYGDGIQVPRLFSAGAQARGAGLTLRACRDCGSRITPAAPARIPFSTVRTRMAAATSGPERTAALQAGVDSARAWRTDLMTLTSKSKGPIPGIRSRITTETGVTVDPNPYVGVSEDRVEQAYRAVGEGAVSEPWLLLALWVKEGRAAPTTNSIAASSATNARSIWRSKYYYWNMGLDHFTHMTATSGDNVIDETDAGASAHEADFGARVADQVAAGRLGRDISADINGEISATPNPATPGQFTVTPTARFYSLSLLLADAYFREQASAVASDPRIGAAPDPGLVYARWNLGPGRFAPFVASAESHRMEAAYNLPAGGHPTIGQWALHRTVRPSEYGAPRTNAIRFEYYVEAYRLIYEGFPP